MSVVLYIRQIEGLAALRHRLGHKGQVGIGQVGIGSGSGEIAGGSAVALDLHLDAVVVQLQHTGVAILRFGLDLRVKLFQNLAQIAGLAVRGDGFGQRLSVHAHLRFPGHLHQVEGHAVFLEVLRRDASRIVRKGKLVDLADTGLVEIASGVGFYLDGVITGR